MGPRELNELNYRRISWINILLMPPLVLLFGWPFYMFGFWFEIPGFLQKTGSLVIALSFSLTILHGHVTMALGALHRHHYHEWLNKRRWSYGFLIRPFLFTTRFRLFFLMFGFALLLSGIML